MSTLKIHCFQHVPFEGLGCIDDWANKNGHEITYTRFFDNETIPATKNYDWLIIMGGPMGIYDNEEYPWLPKEKEAIKKAIDENKTVMGICLGAQLIADVLDAKVYKNPETEIGWFDIEKSNEGKQLPLLEALDNKLKVFHWHGDTFELPKGAKHIFCSKACINQGFLFKDNVLGLQFHFEVTEKSIKSMLKNVSIAYEEGKYVQTENEILSLADFEENNKSMFRVLDNLVLSNNS